MQSSCQTVILPQILPISRLLATKIGSQVIVLGAFVSLGHHCEQALLLPPLRRK
jgi:hypothetical protein